MDFMSEELIVTGCIVSPCRNEPEWLVPSILSVMGQYQLDTLLQVCPFHLVFFGYADKQVDDLGFPARLVIQGNAQITTTGRPPHHMRTRRAAHSSTP